MSPIRHWDWDGLVLEYIQERQENAGLTYEQFYRNHGIPPRTGRKTLGKRLGVAWGKVVEKAEAQVTKQAGINLAETVLQVLKVNQALLGQGAGATFSNRKKKISVRQKDGSHKITEVEMPPLEPEEYTDAVSAIKAGTRGIVETVGVLAGGDRLLPPGMEESLEEVIEWNDPAASRSKSKRLKGRK